MLDTETVEVPEVIETPTPDNADSIVEEIVSSGEATTPDETAEDKSETESVGIANLRSAYKELEDDVNNVYKPVHAEVEKYGGLDALKERLSLADALEIFDEDTATQSFLDALYNFSGSRYNAVIEKIFKDHGEQYLEKRGIGATAETVTPPADWEKDLDPEDPVKQRLDALQAELQAIKDRDKNAATETAAQEAARIVQEGQTRVQEFLTERYAPLEAALEKLDFGEETEFYRNAIRSTVEGRFDADKEAMDKFNKVGIELEKNPQATKLYAKAIAEIDRKVSELIQETVTKFTANVVTKPAEVKQKIEENDIPAISQVPAEPARATIADGTSAGKAFDTASMQSRLRLLESQGRFGPSR